MPPRRPPGLRWLVVLLAVVAAAGCAAGDEVPEGFTRVQAEGLAFAHPSDWRDADEAARTPDAIAEVQGPPDARELRPVLSVVRARALTDQPTLDLYLEQAVGVAQSRQPQREVVAEAEVPVPGAEAAQRLDATYVQTRTDGDVRMRALDVVALDVDGTGVVLSLTGPAEVLDDDLVDAVAQSLDLRP